MTATRGGSEGVLAGKPGARWAFCTKLEIGVDGDPYLTRLRLLQTPWAGIYLHRIYRPDADAHPHDHPWDFTSLVLWGSYREALWPDKTNPRRRVTRTRRTWSVARTGRDAAHIITRIHGPLITLVLVGPRRGEWGFWVPVSDTGSRFVPWRTYVAENSTPGGRVLPEDRAASGTA